MLGQRLSGKKEAQVGTGEAGAAESGFTDVVKEKME